MSANFLKNKATRKMTNKNIAKTFDLLASVMELHNENPFKIKTYKNAYMFLRKVEQPLFEMTREEIGNILGIGVTITDRIFELKETGTISIFEKLKEKTPEGIIEMLQIKGLGPKKVLIIWKDLEIETLGELLYACNENQLIKAKGFGLKIQQQVKESIEYFEQSKDKLLWSSANNLIEAVKNYCQIPENQHFEVVGEFAMLFPVIDKLEFVTDFSIQTESFVESEEFSIVEVSADFIHLHFNSVFNIFIHKVVSEDLIDTIYSKSSTADFLKKVNFEPSKYNSLSSIASNLKIPILPPEHRTGIVDIKDYEASEYIKTKDIKGIVHNHSTYSDGMHTLEEMAKYVMEQGFEYFVISDHSVSAFYANGMSIENVIKQQNEIDKLNTKYDGKFKILKGIESDILSNGNLDYPDDVLATFDVVIASIHSNLKMDEEKANTRLIKAIENPYTHILGHPTGRLLLTRNGYPINHKMIIDACVTNNVCIEINANPQRLDIDYQYIKYAMDKGVMISINPDAHNKESIHYVQYGVNVARLGGLKKDFCINTFDCSTFLSKLKK
jgi:DNA polymerase (family X)